MHSEEVAVGGWGVNLGEGGVKHFCHTLARRWIVEEEEEEDEWLRNKQPHNVFVPPNNKKQVPF